MDFLIHIRCGKAASGTAQQVAARQGMARLGRAGHGKDILSSHTRQGGVRLG
jgi:hypothetical protein